jgi:hypothetical protein
MPIQFIEFPPALNGGLFLNGGFEFPPALAGGL